MLRPFVAADATQTLAYHRGITEKFENLWEMQSHLNLLLGLDLNKELTD